MTSSKFLSRSSMFILFVLLLGVLVAPALAQTKPAMIVNVVWQPGEQLSSVVGDDRFVDVQLVAQGNVQFWAVNLVCTFTPVTLFQLDTVVFGPDWGSAADFVAGGSAGVAPNNYSFIAMTNTLTLAASRKGNVPPIGFNGATYTTLLATVRLKIPTQTKAATGTFKCATMEFLNRDGVVIIKGVAGKNTNLSVLPGYTLTGTALLQGLKSHAGIGVSCEHQATAATYNATTVVAGTYTFGIGTTAPIIREKGEFLCTFTGPAATLGNYLTSEVRVNIQSASTYLLPVVLQSGNVDHDAGPDDVDAADGTILTANFNTTQTAYNNGDVTGDAKVDRFDLAIFAGNFDSVGPIDSSHLLLGLGTDYGGTFPNSQLYWGDNLAGAVNPLFAKPVGRNFWPTLSPDGEAFSFVRIDPKTSRHELFTSPTAKPKELKITPKDFTYQALAPSWSPDGSRIAFVCSWDDPQISGFTFNEGYLCIINKDSTGFTLTNKLVKITPPAWFDNNTIIYGGAHTGDATCANTLCFHDIANNTGGLVDADLDFGGNNISDTPRVAFLDDDGDPDTAAQEVLFYRFFDDGAGEYTLRAAFISRTGLTFAVDAFGGTTHLDTGLTTDLDYYDVSPFLDVIYYDFNTTSDVFNNSDFTCAVTCTDLTGAWGATTAHDVDGFVGNPNTIIGSPVAVIWDQDLNNPTELHAHRASVEWVP